MQNENIKKLRKQLKSTPEAHELSEPMSTAVVNYYHTMRNGSSSSSNIPESGVKQCSHTSEPERKLLEIEDILPNTFDNLEEKAKKVFYAYKLLSRAWTYEERRIAELYYFGRKSYAEIAATFSSHDREAIDIAESKTVSSKTIQNRLNYLLKHADLENDQSFGTEEEMLAFFHTGRHPSGASRFIIHNKHNDFYNFMMLCPTDTELKDLHGYFNHYFKTTIPEEDAEENFKTYCNDISNISDDFLRKSFEMEYVFSHFATNDLNSLYDSLGRLSSLVKEIINNILPSVLPNSKYAQEIFKTTFLEKQSAYAISTRLGIDVRTVERTLKEGTNRLNKTNRFQIINIRMIVWSLPFVVMDDLSWSKGKDGYKYFYRWLQDVKKSHSDKSTKLILF